MLPISPQRTAGSISEANPPAPPVAASGFALLVAAAAAPSSTPALASPVAPAPIHPSFGALHAVVAPLHALSPFGSPAAAAASGTVTPFGPTAAAPFHGGAASIPCGAGAAGGFGPSAVGAGAAPAKLRASVKASVETPAVGVRAPAARFGSSFGASTARVGAADFGSAAVGFPSGFATPAAAPPSHELGAARHPLAGFFSTAPATFRPKKQLKEKKPPKYNNSSDEEADKPDNGEIEPEENESEEEQEEHTTQRLAECKRAPGPARPMNYRPAKGKLAAGGASCAEGVDEEAAADDSADQSGSDPLAVLLPLLLIDARLVAGHTPIPKDLVSIIFDYAQNRTQRWELEYHKLDRTAGHPRHDRAFRLAVGVGAGDGPLHARPQRCECAIA